MKRLLPLAILPALLITACSSVNQKEQLMSAAGFRTLVPSTPAQIAHLKSLPQGCVTTVSKKGRTLFLFADAQNNRLLAGTQSQYQKYQQLRLQKNLVEDKEATAALNADANSEWAAWGGLDAPLWGPGW
jgi:hypothetical protein